MRWTDTSLRSVMALAVERHEQAEAEPASPKSEPASPKGKSNKNLSEKEKAKKEMRCASNPLCDMVGVDTSRHSIHLDSVW